MTSLSQKYTISQQELRNPVLMVLSRAQHLGVDFLTSAHVSETVHKVLDVEGLPSVSSLHSLVKDILSEEMKLKNVSGSSGVWSITPKGKSTLTPYLFDDVLVDDLKKTKESIVSKSQMLTALNLVTGQSLPTPSVSSTSKKLS